MALSLPYASACCSTECRMKIIQLHHPSYWPIWQSSVPGYTWLDKLRLRLRHFSGPWPYSPLEEVAFLIVLPLVAESVARGCSGCHLIHNIRVGGHLRHQVLILGIVKLYIKHISFKRRAQVLQRPRLLLLLSKLSLELGSRRAGLWLCPKGKYASRVALCAVEKESRKIITTSADGGCQCCQFSSCVAASSLQLQKRSNHHLLPRGNKQQIKYKTRLLLSQRRVSQRPVNERSKELRIAGAYLYCFLMPFSCFNL